MSLLLGDLLLLEVLGELFQVEEVDAGLEQQLVTSLDFSTLNKAILVPFHYLLYYVSEYLCMLMV